MQFGSRKLRKTAPTNHALAVVSCAFALLLATPMLTQAAENGAKSNLSAIGPTGNRAIVNTTEAPITTAKLGQLAIVKPQSTSKKAGRLAPTSSTYYSQSWQITLLRMQAYLFATLAPEQAAGVEPLWVQVPSVLEIGNQYSRTTTEGCNRDHCIPPKAELVFIQTRFHLVPPESSHTTTL